jgi:hypothetical protein
MDRRRSSRRRQAKLGGSRDDDASPKVETLSPAINQINEPDDGNLVRFDLRKQCRFLTIILQLIADLNHLDVSSLRNYKKVFRLRTKHANASKVELAAAAARHFATW